MLWVIGVATSLLTAIYMFRLVFLTFHGERGAPRPDADGHGAHGTGTVTPRPTATTSTAAHGGHLHDAPPAMAAALLILAVGSVVAGYVGVPHALGGRTASSRSSSRASTRRRRTRPAHAAPVAEALRQCAEPRPNTATESATELTLMAVSSAIALLGIGIAAYFFLMQPRPRRFGGAQLLGGATGRSSTSTGSTSSTTPRSCSR